MFFAGAKPQGRAGGGAMMGEGIFCQYQSSKTEEKWEFGGGGGLYRPLVLQTGLRIIKL